MKVTDFIPSKPQVDRKESPPRPPPPPPPAPARGYAPASQFAPAAVRQAPVDLTGGAGTASSLRTEVLGDGQVNCLEKAVQLAGPRDSIILLNDSRDQVGHALVQRKDGSVVDPNHPTVRYETLGQWQAMHPEYTNPVSVPAGQVQQALSTPPGAQRDALLKAMGIGAVADRQVADSDTRWVTPTDSVNIRSGPGVENTRVGGQNPGDKMEVIGQNEEGTWLNVRLSDGTVGWVSADLVTDTDPPPPPRFPDWLENGTRPPDIDAATWHRLLPEDQQQIIQDRRFQEVAKGYPEPAWLQNGTHPPGIDAERWQHLPRADQQDVIREGREQWQAAIREQTALLFGGVPEGGVRSQTPFITVGSTLGDGQVGQWKAYAVQQGNAAQYLNLEKMFGKDEGLSAAHYNLCGPLAVGASLGMGPREALTLFKDHVSAGPLKDGKSATTRDQLVTMYEAAGWTAEKVNGASTTTPRELAQWLAEGKQILALVNIDPHGADGMLRPMTDTQRVPHFVNVRSVEEGANGEWFVRVYNSYQNSEEVYSWDDFQASWSATGGFTKNEDGTTTTWSNTGYSLVVASPPED